MIARRDFPSCNFILSVAVSIVCCQADLIDTKPASQPQNPHLRDIILGRCYENPPQETPGDGTPSCTYIADSLLSVLEDQVDEDINDTSYFMYLGMTSYDSPKDSAMFVWPPPATRIDAEEISGRLNVVLPETTEGGSLIQGLVFCGSNRQDRCPVEYWKEATGALLSFWQSVYSSLASKMEGQVRLLLLEDDVAEIPNLWENTILTNLGTGISEIKVFAMNCRSRGVADLLAYVEVRIGITSDCTSIKSFAIASKRDEWCDVTVQLSNESDANSSRNHDNLDWTTMVPSRASDDMIDCRQCPRDERSEENVYAYLFWALILLGAAIVYSIWSVRHYIPEYQSVPNVAADRELEASNHLLPKQ